MNLSTAKLEIKRWGFLLAVYAAFMSRLKPWLTLCLVGVRPLDRNKESPPLAANREVRVVTTEELLAASADPVNDLDSDWVRRAQARGDICVAVFEGEKILSYLWRSFVPVAHEKQVWVSFDSRYPYAYKAFTHPDYRRQGLQNCANYLLDSQLRERGFSHDLGFVESHNYPSYVAAFKRGSWQVGFAGYLGVFGRVIPFASPGARQYGFCFFVSADKVPADKAEQVPLEDCHLDASSPPQ